MHPHSSARRVRLALKISLIVLLAGSAGLAASCGLYDQRPRSAAKRSALGSKSAPMAQAAPEAPAAPRAEPNRASEPQTNATAEVAATPVTEASTPISSEAPAANGFPRIVLDGDTSDWPANEVFLADDDYLYFRFTVVDQQGQNRLYTLQSAPFTTVLWIDTDANKGTGVTSRLDGLTDLGVDLEISFSPRNRNARGAAVYTVANDGTRTPIETIASGLTFAPTYASTWYEGRISRRLPATARPLASTGNAKGVAATLGANGQPDAYADPSSITLPPISSGQVLIDASLPGKPECAIRVLSYNILRSSPVAKPEAFKRVFQALDPDVLILQEWEEGDSAAVQGWFTALIPSPAGASSWSVAKAPGDLGQGGGVVIVSKHPIVGEPRSGLTAPSPEGDGKNLPVRFVGATIRTPMGDVLAGSVHLKARGSIDSPEDRRRMAEAASINSAFRGLFGSEGLRVIAGDMNLVGSRPPLDMLRTGLDFDATDLNVADAMVLGDNAMYTWAEEGNDFSPGRLDYLLYSDSSASVANAFLLDTRRLSDAALARIGLDRTDTAASDHLPMVVDFVPKATQK